MDPALGEQELFERIKCGDEGAFASVYMRYHAMLYTLALRLVKDTDAAKDAVQYVFVKLWELRGELTITINLRNYLYTMTKNYILNYIRHNSQVVVHSYVITQLWPQQDDSLSTHIERRDIGQKLEEAISRLPRQQRTVLTMKQDGYSTKEIAERMDVSVNTVKTHYSDALKQLRQFVGPLLKIITTLLFIRSI